LFDLNICAMLIESEKDFARLREHIIGWYHRFPMFRHDVVQIETVIEEHIKQHSIAMVYHRQSHKKHYLEIAQKHIDEINRVISLVEKIELMAILSQG